MEEMATGGEYRPGGRLLGLPFGQPLLTAPLCFPQLGFFSYARLFVESTALEFAEQSFAGQFFLGDLESFFNVVIEDFDFHPIRLSTFSG